MMPDFTAQITAVSPDTVSVGATITVDVRVLEGSGLFTGNIVVSAGLVGRPVVNGSVFVQSGQGTTTLSFMLAGTGLSPGLIDVQVVADASQAVAESSETNNAATAGITLTGADLQIVDFRAPDILFPGRQAIFDAEIRNDGPGDSVPFIILIDVDRRQVVTTTVAALAPGQARSLRLPGAIPADLPIGDQAVRLLLDVGLVVPETRELNNARTLQVPVRAPAADLVPAIERAPPMVEAGQLVSIGRVIRNLGVEAAPAVEHVYRLEPIANEPPVIVGSASFGVDAGDEAFGQDSIRIPAETAEGTRTLTLIADANDRVAELDETNNAATVTMTVLPAPLQILPRALPPGRRLVAYDVQLFAQGGTPDPRFSLVGGTLPFGLALSVGGNLFGRPTEGGVFDLVIRAEAGASVEVERTLTITQLAGPATPLPTAFLGSPYRAQLSDGLLGEGVEYVPPLTFEALSLPRGFSLSETGQLEGVPDQPGPYTFTIVVSSAVGAMATVELDLLVVDPQTGPQIVPTSLPDAFVGREYCDPNALRLSANGGNGALAWSALDPLPPGMTLAANGSLCGVPARAGDYDFIVRVEDEAQLFDTERFRLTVDGADLVVLPEQLPAAVVNAAYSAQLVASGGAAPYDFAVETGMTPPGIALSADGQLTGAPMTEGLFPFAVRVTDAGGVTAVVARSILVRTPETLGELAPGDSGCRCGRARPSAGLAWVALGLAALAWRRRRGTGL